eukprot:m.115193 g.115193  ORF g.115193 m.115193 type:complete len:301 (+) comp16046_c1_seq2:1258-2160(+)
MYKEGRKGGRREGRRWEEEGGDEEETLNGSTHSLTHPLTHSPDSLTHPTHSQSQQRRRSVAGDEGLWGAGHVRDLRDVEEVAADGGEGLEAAVGDEVCEAVDDAVGAPLLLPGLEAAGLNLDLGAGKLRLEGRVVHGAVEARHAHVGVGIEEGLVAALEDVHLREDEAVDVQADGAVEAAQVLEERRRAHGAELAVEDDGGALAAAQIDDGVLQKGKLDKLVAPAVVAAAVVDVAGLVLVRETAVDNDKVVKLVAELAVHEADERLGRDEAALGCLRVVAGDGRQAAGRQAVAAHVLAVG